MSERNIPRTPRAAADEKFIAQEPATGASFAIREMSDPQLENYLQNALQQLQGLRQELMNLLIKLETVANASAIMAYEVDRRARTIAIVSDLSTMRPQ